MKLQTIALILLSLAFCSAADGLTAAVAEPASNSFYLGNCEAAGTTAGTGEFGASTVEVRFIVTNEWGVPMTVKYDYYDYGIDGWVPTTSQICTIAAHLPDSNCRANVPIRLGGRGNGTMADAELIRLRGVDPEGDQSPVTKDFSFKIEHYTDQLETNSLQKIDALRMRVAELGTAAGTCLDAFCCGPPLATMASAQATIVDAEASLKKCNLTNAYNKPAQMLQQLSQYDSNASSQCTSAVASAKGAKQVLDSVSPLKANCTAGAEKISTAESAYNTVAAKLSSANYAAAKQAADSAAALANEAKVQCASQGTQAVPPTTEPPAEPATPQTPAPPASPQPSEQKPCALLFAFPLLALLAAFRQKVA